MARSRNIKPGFFTNDELAQCEYGARLLFTGLWTLADREGRMEDRPLRIKMQLFPGDNCDIEPWLNQLAARKFITRYVAGDCKYIQVNNFKKHQNPHIKEPASTIPAPDLSGANTIRATLIPDSLLPITDSLILIPESNKYIAASAATKTETADEPTAKSYSDEFEKWWNLYPPGRDGRRRGKSASYQIWQRSIRVAERQALCTATENYTKSQFVREGFVKDPERFLKKDFWRDYLGDAVGMAASNPAALYEPGREDDLKRAFTEGLHGE